MEKISYIVPTLNEVDNIEKTINKIEYVSNDLNLDFEIICIDAFSTDGTVDKITQNQNHKKIKLENQKNLDGPSQAIFQGILSSTGNYLIILDADNAIDEICLKKIIIARKFNRLVIGSRFLKNSSIKNVSKIKLFFSVFFSNIISFILKKKIHDTSHSLRLFPKGLNFLPTKLIHPFFFWENTIFCKRAGLEILEIPVNYTERTMGITKLSNLRLLKNTISSIVGLIKITLIKK